MALVICTDDSVAAPDGYASRPHYSSMQMVAAVALTTPTSATIVTDADCWSVAAADGGGQQPAQTAGGPVVSATAGTFTATRAGNYRVAYNFSKITVVNGQVLTTEVFVGSSGFGGRCILTQLTAAPATLAGETFVTLAVGDVVTVKVIADTGNFTAAEGFIVVQEL